MTPFRRVTTDEAERHRLIEEYRKEFERRPEYFAGFATFYDLLAELLPAFDFPTWRNDTYQVTMFDDQPSEGFPELLHLSIKRIDKQPIRDWRDLQEIKNQIVGPEHEAVELFPAESRLVDLANQYHIFVLKDPKIRFPFGFQSRHVDSLEIAGSKQRPRS